MTGLSAWRRTMALVAVACAQVGGSPSVAWLSRRARVAALVGTTLVIGAGARSANAQAVSPNLLAQQASHLADTISVEWSHSLNRSGDIVNPLTEEVEGGYGRTMLAYGMLRAYQRNPELDLLPTVQRALPRSDDVTQAPFNLLGLSETLLHAHGTLGPTVTEALTTSVLSAPLFGGASGTLCLDTSGCYYYNKTLVNAAGLLVALAALPGKNGSALTSFSSPATTARRVRNLLSVVVPRAEIPDGRLTVGRSHLTGAVLSDPTDNPTAYLALSTMMLGRALDLYSTPPASALLAFRRAVVALLGLTAPDGDIAYMGRGQGQVWASASAAAACALAMRLLPGQPFVTSHCEGLIAAELGALASRRQFGGIGIATVPRLNWLHGGGVDHYANATDYNGLTVYALNLAADAMETLPDPGELALPSAVSGERFLDPRGSGLATTGLNGLWFAIHKQAANKADSRWGFGLLAMQRFTGGTWANGLTPRPLGPGSQGPVLVVDGHHYDPVGSSMHVTPGRIGLEGGWSDGERLFRRASFRYEVTAQGIVLRVHVTKGDRLIVRDWTLPGHTSTMSVAGPAGTRIVTRLGTAAGNDQSATLEQVSWTLQVRKTGRLRVLWRG